jgi:hypothetical protein
MIWLNTYDEKPFWPATESISRGMENGFARIHLLQREENGAARPASGVINVLTPAGARREWASFLVPPLVAGAAPAFTLLEIERVMASCPGAILVRPDCELPLPPEPLADIHVLVATLHLDLECLELIAQHVIRRLRPDLAAAPIRWEGSPPTGLGEALLQVHCLEHDALKEYGRDAMRLQALADDIWMNQVLPLRARMEDNRPPYTIPEHAAPFFPSQHKAPAASASRQERIAMLEALRRWQLKYPELMIDEAIDWLSKLK